MPIPQPFVREAGAGPTVVCIHSNGSTSSQWRGLMDLLARDYRVLAPDSYGSGKTAEWPPQQSPPNGADGIRNTVRAAGGALDTGDKDLAARHFIDFWMGSGSWDTTPAQRKPAIAASVVNIRRWSHALFTEPTPAQAFAALDVPVLYMLGDNSPESAHAVARVLLSVLSRVKVIRFPGLGHMAPLTHPEVVNAEIARFLAVLTPLPACRASSAGSPNT